jgi:hypothetical protein
MIMEYIFFVGVAASWLAAGGIGAFVALRELQSDWGNQLTFRRMKGESMAPATVPKTPSAKRRFTR